MRGTVDLKLVHRIRHFLYQRGDQGATMNDFLQDVDRDYGAVHGALEHLKEKGEAYYKQKMGRVFWYLKEAR